jgi:FlaA1/EpsC-like NDP-sugar epimerase
VQACLTSGLLLTGTLYLVHAEDIPRSIVLVTVGLVTIALSLRRLVYRILLLPQLRARSGHAQRAHRGHRA